MPGKKLEMNELKQKATQAGDSELEQQMHDALSALLKTPVDNLPGYVQKLLVDSQQKNVLGDVSWALAGLWALGKVEYVPVDLWTGTPAEWNPVTDAN